MLQSTEYQPMPYLKWYWRTNNFSRVANRRSLEQTKAARLLKMVLAMGVIVQIIVGLTLIIMGATGNVPEGMLLGLAIIIAYPILWAHLVVLPLWLGRLFIVSPKQRQLITQSKEIFANHPGVKIAVAGSYGKTSMKELLQTILSEGKNVAATPGNKNVSVSHAVFASRLSGKEDVIIIEYGEGEPGDVKRFCEITQPNIGIITGIAPAHLDKYPSLDAVARDIFSLADYLKDESVYVNGDSMEAKPYINTSHHVYTPRGVDGLRVKNIKVDIDGTSFDVIQQHRTTKFHTRLLGTHHIGPLVAVIAIAHKLGLTDDQLVKAVAKTAPYEHRMQPYKLGGAWIIDDTYNGNIEGIRAGLRLLGQLEAKRKIYVTPGLVDQGIETERVHREMARLIAAAKPDKTILMENSATKVVVDELDKLNYSGDVVVQDVPLAFYQNLEHFVAAGDVVLMQNDWTDNYF